MPESQNGMSSWGTIKPQTPKGEKTLHRVQHVGRKEDYRTQLESAPCSLSLSPWSLPTVVTKAISNNPARETIWKRLSLQRRTAACGPGCWHDARRCRQAARPTSPATETHEQRLRWASAPPPALKLPVRGSFAPRRGSDSSINQTQNHLNDRCVFIVVWNKCDDNSSCVAGVLPGRPEHWPPGQLLPGLPWLSVNCPTEF